MTTDQGTITARSDAAGRPAMWKFFVYSAIGAFMFFVPFTFNGKNSIALDHLVTWLRTTVPDVLPYVALLILVAGAVYPFVSGTWNKSLVSTVFSVMKVLGMVVGFLLVFEIGPAWLFADDMGPFLLNSLVIPVGLLVPIGAVFLALLVGYGLMEFVGVMVQPIMRPLFKTPGRSAVDAVASFVGSYSLALLITNRVYKQGKYTGREAAIIATGFSTVSATFMVVVANTLDLMGHWNLYFWSTLVITFIVTAITVWLPPLRTIPDEYHPDATPDPEDTSSGNRLGRAWTEAGQTVRTAPSLGRNIWDNFKDGLVMAMAFLPSILSIGLLGLVLAEFTPVFDILGYLFYPITWALQVPEPLLVAKASALGISEMFLPALLVAESAMAAKFVIAVTCVSQIIFFSAMVPCIVASEIPVSISQMVIIWFERVVLTLLITIPFALVLF